MAVVIVLGMQVGNIEQNEYAKKHAWYAKFLCGTNEPTTGPRWRIK